MPPDQTSRLARTAYDALAADYDRFTGSTVHTAWVDSIIGAARTYGLSGSRALDVACGTGKATLALAERGFDVTGVDISPHMLALAARKLPEAPFVCADMRELPALGGFDLVTCLDDAINHLLTVPALRAAFRSIARQMRPGGLLAFDTNSLAPYEANFALGKQVGLAGGRFRVRGATDVVSAGALCRTTIHPPGGQAGIEQVQRHHPIPVIERCVRDAGLDVIAVRGQDHAGRLRARFAPERDPKALWFVQQPCPTQRREEVRHAQEDQEDRTSRSVGALAEGRLSPPVPSARRRSSRRAEGPR